MAYVPDHIICGASFPDPNMIDIANKCPHLTMMVGKWAPVKSNYVLNALF